MTLEEKIKLMEQYLSLKIEERDFHGVADAAMDLRELEAVLKYRSDKLNTWLKENGKVVYTTNGFYKDSERAKDGWQETLGEGMPLATHKALLICVEPLEKCKDEMNDNNTWTIGVSKNADTGEESAVYAVISPKKFPNGMMYRSEIESGDVKSAAQKLYDIVIKDFSELKRLSE